MKIKARVKRYEHPEGDELDPNVPAVLQGAVAVLERDPGAGHRDKVKRNGYLYHRARVWIENSKGVRERITVYGSTEAQLNRKLKKELSRQTAIDPNRTKFGEYVERWLESTKADVRQATYNLYKGTADRYLIPQSRLGNAKLGKLHPEGLKKFLTELGESGVGARTCQTVYAVLFNLLNWGVRQNHILRNPMVAVKRPKAPATNGHILTLSQSQTLLDKARSQDCFALIFLALTTAMREGELFALQWNEVNLDQGSIRVTHTLTKDNKGRLIRTEPKTDESRRTIYLDSETIQVLTEHKKRQRAAGYIGPQVFTSPEWHFINKDTFRSRVFKPLLAKAELPDITFHSLRHVSNSLLAAKGVPLKVLQERLGHSTSKITFDTYSHVYEESQREATTKLGKLFKGWGQTGGQFKKPTKVSRKSNNR